MSNPTPIYRIRTISYDSGIFMEVDVVEFAPNTNSLLLKFEERLEVSPSRTQSTINFQNVLAPLFPNLADQVVNLETLQNSLGLSRPAETFSFRKSAPAAATIALGNDADLIWGRKFKFGIKSRSSGKIIDLNVSYEYERRVIE